MNSDEYHAPDLNEGDTQLRTCLWCGQPWGDHENTCPYIPGEDLAKLGREEDRVYADLREQWTEGP
jgi:hypothetical protein